MRSHYAWQLGTPSRVYIPSLLQLAQKTQPLELWKGSCRRVVRSFKKHLYFTQPPTIDSYTEYPKKNFCTLEVRQHFICNSSSLVTRQSSTAAPLSQSPASISSQSVKSLVLHSSSSPRSNLRILPALYILLGGTSMVKTS